VPRKLQGPLAGTSRERENGKGKPATPVPLWPSRPSESLALGPDQKGRTLCHEHAKQNFGLHPRAPSLPLCNQRVQEEGDQAVGINGGNVVDVGPDEADHLLERAAAIDVAKASGKVCVRLPHPRIAGRRETRIWDVVATTNAIMALADELVGLGVERVVLESTSDYWRPFFYLFEAGGLVVWLVCSRDVKNVPGRPKTDKLDALWLCKLNERGMLRPSFVPPVEIRHLRDYTRLRADLVADRCRYVQRIEKLLEDALIKVSTVASDILGKSGRAMLEALIAGERRPAVLADMALGKMRAKRAALVEALTGRFDAHHAELARVLLDQVDALTAKIDQLTARAGELIAAMPAAQAPVPVPAGGPGLGSTGTCPVPLPVLERLDEVTGIGLAAAQAIVAEVGLDMAQFPTPARLVSWAKLSPRTVQSGARTSSGNTGKGDPYLRRVLSEAAASAGRTDTFLGERYRRLVRRRGKQRALVAVARSILVIVWHLLDDPMARFADLGPNYYEKRMDKGRRTRDLVRQLQALGHQVSLSPAA
jgi:transposase